MNEQTFLPEHFINRELSWLEFNARVLDEALDPEVPLLERVKFLNIFSSNLDEFFMVRVSGLREQAFEDGAPQDFAPDGLRPITQLERIAARTKELVEAQYRCWNDEVLPQLAKENIRLPRYADLDERQRASLDDFWTNKAFPILTPMAVDPAHPSPRYHNRGLYIGALLDRRSGLGPKHLFAVVQVPQVLPRLVPVSVSDEEVQYVFLEDIIAARLTDLFGGFDVQDSTTFRVTRDSDIDLLDQESDDMLRDIEARLRARQRGQAVRLEVAADSTEELIREIVEPEALREPGKFTSDTYSEVYRIPGPLDLTALMELLKVPGREQLREPSFTPRMPRLPGGQRRDDWFTTIRNGDVLLHHPYDSFEPVVEFVSRAARDPHVLAIKQTLYRTSGDSPVLTALEQAAENGKHVTALLELKARFDEERNVGWARRLERAGVHVVFGFLDLKTHCKLSMVVRQEGDAVRRYVHLGTGNYNPATALVYTDLGLFTADEAMVADASALFNLLTGYSQGHAWRKMVAAPTNLHLRTIELIEEQAQRAREGKPSWIFAKLNSLVDYRVCEALYRASQAGVPIEIICRGICGLRPGLPGISETITVRSIVDRFLEHSRIYIFGPRDDCQIYLASADWMPRNFYRRVETMFPLEAPTLRQRILEEIVPAYLRDNVKARFLQSDGTYTRPEVKPGEARHRCQEELLYRPGEVQSAEADATAESNGEAPRSRRSKKAAAAASTRRTSTGRSRSTKRA